MQHTTPTTRPDPHERLRRLKVVVASVTGGLVATMWWLVAGHAAGSTATPNQVAPVFIGAHQDDDEHAFFGGGSSLSDGGSRQPVMRSSGS